MKGVALAEAEPGMVIAKSVVINSKSGNEVLVTVPGTVLTERLIRKLEILNVNLLFIKTEMKAKIFNKEAEMIYKAGHTYIQQTLKSVRGGKISISLDYLLNYVSKLVKIITKSPFDFLRIAGVKGIDDYVSYHSIDVAIYSIMLGLNMRLTETEMLQLGIGALIHDIGMSRVPLSIININRKLSDEELLVVKSHIKIAKQIGELYPDMGNTIPAIIEQHHERYDGSGYGKKLKGNAINNLARMVAIADVYDAITSDRVYKKGQLPHLAAEYMLSLAYTDFDPGMMITFAQKVVAYPVGSVLLLSTGEVGTVVELNKDNYLRPKIQIFMTRTNDTLERPYIIDLSKKLNIIIKDIID